VCVFSFILLGLSQLAGSGTASGRASGTMGSASGVMGSASGSGSNLLQSDPNCIVFDASITQFFEEDIPATGGSGSGTGTGSVDWEDMSRIFVPMKAERMTDEYRQRAIAFYKKIYGLDFSQNVDGIQLVPLEMNRAIDHVVTSAYADQLPAGLTPSSNLKVIQDFWTLKLTDGDRDLGSGGELQGLKLKHGDLTAYGEFRYLDADGKEVIPKVIFSTPFPLEFNKVNIHEPHLDHVTVGSGTASAPAPGTGSNDKENVAFKWIPIFYNLDSPVWGKGLATGMHFIKEFDTKKVRQQRVIATFPTSLSELATTPGVASKCVKIST